MTNLVTVLRRAVETLDDNNEQARAAIYARAKSALEAQLRGLDPPLPPEALESQIGDLEAAIAQVEAEYAGADDAAPDDPAVSVIERELGGRQPEAGAAAALAPERGAVSQPHESFRSAVAQTASLGTATMEAARSARSAYDELQDHGGDEVPETAVGGEDGPFRSDLAEEGVDGAPPDEFPDSDYQSVQSGDYGDDYETGGRGVGIAMWAIVFLMIAGIAGAAFWQREALTEVVMSFGTEQSDVVEAAEDAKIDERVPPADTSEEATADETDAPVATEARAAEPALPQQTRVAQALLVEEGPENSLASLSGSVDWALLDDPEAPQEAAKVIRGTVQIPDKNMSLTLAIRRNTDPDLPASHTVELLFDVPSNFENQGIAGVAGLVMKATPQSSGQPLIGAVVPVTEEFYLLGLSESEFDRARNIDEMRRRNFIDIPIVYADEGRAILSIAKGESGNEVFRDAFEAWGY